MLARMLTGAFQAPLAQSAWFEEQNMSDPLFP